MLFSINNPNHCKITYTNIPFRLWVFVILFHINFISSAAENWNVIWQDDFGVEEDSVVRDFADPSMSVPGHICNPAADISDGYYGIANSTAWSFIKKKSVNRRENYHFVPGRDHTGNQNGAMLIVNAGGRGNGESIYENSLNVKLCGSHTYRFSMYVANISAAYLSPKLTLKAVNVKDPENPEELASYVIPERSLAVWPESEKNSLGLYTHKERPWTEAEIEFEANEGDVVKIVISNNCSSGNGNDFAIDDITLERLDNEEVIKPEFVSELSAETCLPTYSISNSELVEAWNKIYSNVYFLWQYSTDNGYTWTNIPEASGIEKTVLSRTVPSNGKEVYRLIITGADTENSAKQKAEEIGLNGTPSDGCDYFSISNIISQVDIQEIPKAYTGIDNKQNVTSQEAFDCESIEHRVSLIAPLWDKSFPSYFIRWQYSYDDNKWLDLDESNKSFLFTDEFDGLTYFRAILAEKEEVAIQVAKNGEPDDLCERNFYITNSVSLECLNACKKPEYTAVKDKQTICEDQETEVTWAVTQTNTAKVKGIEWYSKAEGETEWTLIEGENRESISLENPKISTEYLFLAINGKCISDSVKFQLNVNEAISLKPVADIDICEGEDATLTATVINGKPTKFIWNGEESASSDFTIENVMADKHVTLSATDGICVSPEIETDIKVEKIATANVKQLPAVICEGESVDLNATANLTNANTFAWKKGSVIITESDLQTTDTPTSDATYTLTINGTHCPSIDITKSVKVEKKSELKLSISKSEVCENDEVTLSLTSKNATSFVWKKRYKGDSEFFELEETDETITFNAIGSADYVVVSKNESACESVSSNIVSLNVENIAIVSVKNIPEMICEGDVLILAANLQLSEANTFKWQRDGEDIPSIGAFTSDTPAEDASYTLTVFGKKCPNIVKELSTKVEKPADLELSISDDVVCENALVTLNLIATNATDFVWKRKLEGKVEYSQLNETGESISIIAEKSASFIVSSLGGKVCGSTESNIVSYTIEDSVRFAITPLPDTLCVGEAAELNASLTSGQPTTITWERDGVGIASALAFSDENLADGMNRYALTVNGNKCPAVTRESAVFKATQPEIILAVEDNVVCEDDNAVISLQLDNALTPIWEKSVDNQNFTSFDNSIQDATKQSVGTYYRVKSRSTGRCPFAYSNVVFVDVEQKANVDIEPLPERICEGEIVNLVATATLSPVNNFSWKKGNNVITESNLSTTDVPTEDVSYTFTVTGEKCPVIEKMVNTKIEKKAEVLLSASDTDVCENADVTLNADVKNVSMIVWKVKLEGDNEFKPINHISNTYTLSATKTAQYAVSTLGLQVCPNVESNIVKINVEDSVRLAITPLTDTLCVGEAADLNASITSGQPTTITWERDGVGIASALAFSDENLADGMNRYALTVNGNKCPAVTRESSVFKASQPEIILAVEDNVVCEDDNAVISLQLDNAFTPIWEKSVDNQNFTSFDNSIQDATKQSVGTYYRVKSRSTGRCPFAYSNVVFVDVEHKANVDIESLPARVCEGEIVNLVATATLSPVNNFSWKKGNDVITESNLSTTDVPTEDVSYSFTVTGEKCPVIEKLVNTKVEKKAEVLLSASDTDVCENADVTLNADVKNASMIVWKVKLEGDNEFKPINHISNTYTLSATKTAQYAVSTLGLQVCPNVESNIVKINVEDSVRFAITPLPDTLCVGEAAELNASITSGQPTTITWEKDGVGIASALAFSDENLADGMNRYALTVNGNKCPAVTRESAVFKATQPEIILAVEDNVVCEDDNAVISLQLDNALTPIWEKSVDNQNFTSFDNSIKDATKQSVGTYYRVKSRSTGRCPFAYSNVVFVDVEHKANVDVEPLPERICEGEAVKLTAKGKIPNTSSISWGKGNEVLTTTNLSLSDIPTEDATYIFTVIGNKCPTVTLQESVQVEHLVDLDLLVNIDTICSGSEVTLSTNFDYISGIQWEEKGENDTRFKKIDAGKNEIVAMPAKNTIYRLSATSELGCKEKGVEKKVFVDIPAGLKVTGKSICEGDTTLLVALTEHPFQKIEWREEGSNEIISENAMVSLYPKATTTYTVNAYNGVCKEEATATVMVSTIPRIVSHEDIGNRSYQMMIDETSEPVYFDYNNGNGKTMSDILTNVFYGKTYNIEVSNELGCVSNYVFKVPTFDLFFHKYFYQGEENWKVGNLDRYENTKLSIYDRTGKLLFVENGTTDGWNGEYNGYNMPSTDYWYVVDIPELDKQYTGHFTLLRR